MISEDASYHWIRAEAEVELPQQVRHRRAPRAHYDLSAPYLELVYGVVDHVSRASGD